MTQKEPVSKKEYYNILCRMIKELDYDLQKLYEKMMDDPYFTVGLTNIRTEECDIQEQYNKRLMKENDRYRKTLEDVERAVRDEMCDTSGRLCVYCDGKNSCITFKILDIINKAKEQE